MKTSKILIVDDELSVRTSLSEWFLEDGFRVETAESGEDALQKMHGGPYDLILLDIKMPGMDGITLQKRIKEIDSDVVIIIMTAYASVETAVEALKLGAFDYVTKPFDPDDLTRLVRNALKQKDLADENIQLKEKISELSGADEIIGESDGMKRVFELVDTVAETDSTVLIRGESGTGKELVARAIHSRSKRRYFPIVAVNCGAITETLLESELFGHEKGAFTGAQYRRKGKIELANGGTLFLDEVGDITAKMQVDLLRVIENKRFTRVGGNEEIQVDFRLICATNKNLEKLVEEEKFREDLYYRINVFSIFIPPLRERKSDIMPLTNYFVKKYARSMGKPEKKISPTAQEMLLGYSWPGNVRELENAVERAMVVGKKSEITEADLPLHLNGDGHASENLIKLDDLEKEHIKKILEEAGGNVTRAAALLGIDRVTLYNKIKKYGLKR
ncbi:MAG: sigma-54-dependent Fis family transcriptional regulator [Calditrichaeota bacterium]|nr:sigma-54-dependent Fis family transcriptional regulator [Calditrichota bacterium]RQW08177.1 MAG: sigma-54-dependent Fis family transcriptional regulator [Calditrichota bacterium]